MPAIVDAIHAALSIAISNTFVIGIAASLVAAALVLFLREAPAPATEPELGSDAQPGDRSGRRRRSEPAPRGVASRWRPPAQAGRGLSGEGLEWVALGQPDDLGLIDPGGSQLGQELLAEVRIGPWRPTTRLGRVDEPRPGSAGAGRRAGRRWHRRSGREPGAREVVTADRVVLDPDAARTTSSGGSI